MEQYKKRIKRLNTVLLIVDIVLFIALEIVLIFMNSRSYSPSEIILMIVISIVSIPESALFFIPQIIFGNYLADYIIMKNKLAFNVIEKNDDNTKKYKKKRNKTIIFGIIGTIYYILVYMIALYIVQSA